MDLVGPGAAAVTAVAPYTAIALGDAVPQVHADAWVAPTVVLAGRVTIAERASVWYSSVLRADMDSITVGPGSNVQDGSVLHADPGFPLSIGSGVSVGHRAVLHGCTVGDDVLVGMGAVVLNGARIGAGSLIAAGRSCWRAPRCRRVRWSPGCRARCAASCPRRSGPRSC